MPVAGGRAVAPKRSGLNKDYLAGLDHLRQNIQQTETDLDKIKLNFFQCKKNDEEQFEKYLKGVNDSLEQVNVKQPKKNGKQEVVDSGIKLTSLLNRARGIASELSPGAVGILTTYWKNISETLESVSALVVKFRNMVVKKLLSSCQSYQNNSVTLDVTMKYAEDVRTYQKNIQEILKKIDGLVRSYDTGIKQEYFTSTNFTNHVLAACDERAFPVLRIVPDISEKLMSACRQARQWTDKDETFVHDLSRHIRVARNQTKKKTLEIHNERDKHKKKSKSVKDALNVFNENKEKLKAVEKDLRLIEAQVLECAEAKQFKLDEKKQKEGIVGFLDISIAQTNKNYSLQLKRGRMMRQIRELEKSLQDIAIDLQEVEQEMKLKSAERDSVSEVVDESGSIYKNLKSDLEKFTRNLERLQQELSELAVSLDELEIIQTFKISPEKIEDFYDRPPSVKLAPSLKEKIQIRKRKLLNSDSDIQH